MDSNLIPAKTLEKATAEQFREWKFKKSLYLFDRRVREALKYIPDNSLVLDVGCGDHESIIVVESNRGNVKVIGMDICTLRGDKRGVQASCGAIPFKDNTFDCVLCLAILEHVPYQLKALMEIGRVLKRGGVVIITTPNPFYAVPSRIASSLNLKYKEAYDNSITIGMLEKLLTSAGINVVERRGFLLLPFRNPFERLERILGIPILGFTILLNQIVIGRKVGRGNI
ncbi:MAG: class I SAM-dependent methyltransferase [Candidatus Brocadiales bacterium]|nr:class I SAM-dependent methyltransferase [Candidatus Brocadiales bacterium]